MSEHLGKALDELLDMITPEGGASALLVRHPYGPVYFPSRVRRSNPRTFGDPISPSYYLYSTWLDRDLKSPWSQTLGDATNADELIRCGKLAVGLFRSGPVTMEFYPCSEERRAILVRLTKEGVAQGTPAGVNESLLRAIGQVVRGWEELAVASFSGCDSSPAGVLKNLKSLFEDSTQTPPYFPFLHASLRLKGKRSGGSAEVCTNSLSYNCALLARHQRLRQDFINAMFERAVTEDAFEHTVPTEAKDELARAVAEVCSDLVCVIGRLKDSKTYLCARINVPKENARKVLNGYLSPLKPAVLSSPWELMVYGLDFLANDKPKEVSSLVTAWMGSVSCEDNTRPVTQWALPLGFISGNEQSHLQKISESNALKDLRFKPKYRSAQVDLSVVKLDPNADYWPNVAESLESVLELSERHLGSTKTPPLPHPYRLDFQGVAGNKSLLISSRGGGEGIRSVHQKKGGKLENLYQFLFQLALRFQSKGPPVSHEEVRSHLWPGMKEDKWKEAVTKKLNPLRESLSKESRQGGPPIDHRHLIEPDWGDGWFLHPDTVVVGLDKILKGKEVPESRLFAQSYSPISEAAEKGSEGFIGKLHRKDRKERPKRDNK